MKQIPISADGSPVSILDGSPVSILDRIWLLFFGWMD